MMLIPKAGIMPCCSNYYQTTNKKVGFANQTAPNPYYDALDPKDRKVFTDFEKYIDKDLAKYKPGVDLELVTLEAAKCFNRRLENTVRGKKQDKNIKDAIYYLGKNIDQKLIEKEVPDNERHLYWAFNIVTRCDDYLNGGNSRLQKELNNK